MKEQDLFETTYEEDFLRRDLGSIVHRPDIALTELVANAYDAGASKVKIIVPEEIGGTLTVEDDGEGMSEEHFRKRWMMLRYNRLVHQGPNVSFPPERKGLKRKAFGRNGIGRHGLLCFGDEYRVETWRDGKCYTFDISVSRGDQPLNVVSREKKTKAGHGTRLSVPVFHHLISGESISEMLSARFISTSDFSISVNGRTVPLHEHPGVVDQAELTVGATKIKVTLIDSKQGRKDTYFQGVAVWVGGRRVGEPSWNLGGVSLADGRRAFGKRFVVVVETDGLRDEIVEDWSGFKSGSLLIQKVAEELSGYINKHRRDLLQDEIREAKQDVLYNNKQELEELSPVEVIEVSRFVDGLLEENPDLDPKTLQLAVKAAINLEKSRSGQSLLSKLTSISIDDIDSLDELLAEWTVQDALIALSEIDTRLKVIEALHRFSGDEDADELHTIHPLILKARWLFGPEYESSEYSSNVGLVKTIKQVFGQKIDKESFINAKKRPDIVALKESTIGAQALESVDENGHEKTRSVLLIEVKRGGYPIGRDEINQADGYVQDIAYSEFLGSRPFVNAFVVGERIEPKTAANKEIKDSDDQTKVLGKVSALTFSVLISTAEKRLFRLREKLDRYAHIEDDELLSTVLSSTTTQLKLNADL
ncbi:MAG: ATP-binding protein [Pseudomonadales bacterium]|nr:ATP-binding protein [Pseudomonadales bacterium]